MNKLLLFVLIPIFAWIGGAASSFGTIDQLGQHREHEKITRAALECGIAAANVVCFQPKSMDELAGKSGTFGAVGAPDRPGRGLITSPAPHCDDGDEYQQFDPHYPPPKLHNALVECANWMVNGMLRAALAAARLVLPNGMVDGTQSPTVLNCSFDNSGGLAKCSVLEHFGLTLHAAQDFYSHTNWNDVNPLGGTSTVSPPGMNNIGMAPWLNLRVATGGGQMPPPPPSLISGCFVLMPEGFFCNDGPGSFLNRTPRVKHDVLNKDKGSITLAPGGTTVINAGTTSRGMQNNNFERAVKAAIEDTQDKWLHLQEMLVSAYGPNKAEIMICAITHDNPATSCGGVEMKDVLSFQAPRNLPNVGFLILVAAALFLIGKGLSRAGSKRSGR